MRCWWSHISPGSSKPRKANSSNWNSIFLAARSRLNGSSGSPPFEAKESEAKASISLAAQGGSMESSEICYSRPEGLEY